MVEQRFKMYLYKMIGITIPDVIITNASNKKMYPNELPKASLENMALANPSKVV